MIDTKALRSKVLDLAIQGKLTQQLESDGTAETLLKSVNSKKDISQTENIPFPIPDNWKWAKLCDLYKINPPVTADSSIDAAFIPMEKVNAGFEADFSYEIQQWGVASKNHTKFENDDVAFAKISPCFENRKSFIANNLPNGIGGGTTELIILRQKEMYPKYTYLLIIDQRFITAGSSSYKGVVGQQRVKSDVVKNYYVPVPPLSEQKRIVEKVESIFRLLDIIDEAQKKYSADAEILKSKLVSMGIQGKLTQQLDSDGTAEELFEQIQQEKQKLIKEGKIKKEKPLPPVSDEEIPFEIPDSWMWVRFGELMRNRDSERVPVSVADRKKLAKIYDYYGASGVIDKVETFLFDKRLLLIGEDGANLLSRSTPIAFLAEGKYWVNNHAHVLDSYVDDYLIFVMYYINSISLVPYVTGSAQPKLNQENMNKIPVPLPPLAEQKRIAQVLDEVLKVIG